MELEALPAATKQSQFKLNRGRDALATRGQDVRDTKQTQFQCLFALIPVRLRSGRAVVTMKNKAKFVDFERYGHA